jgi:hypothetical protein
MNKIKKICNLTFFVFLGAIIAACDDNNRNNVSVFPLSNYNQSVDHWIKPSDKNYDQLLLSDDYQKKRLSIFYKHYFGEFSPWDQAYVAQLIIQPTPDDVLTQEKSVIYLFNNKNKMGNEIGYGENFRPYPQGWIEQIKTNANISQFKQLAYNHNQRGIAVDNLHGRALPTDDNYFYSHNIAGQGYPFDNLQMSAVWVGTPVYIMGESLDHAWYLVLTPDIIGWVKAQGIARVDEKFIQAWQAAAKLKMAAITKTQTSVTNEHQQLQFLAYVGAVFPAEPATNGVKLLIPVADENNNAVIKTSVVDYNHAVFMPLSATAHHFAELMKTLIGRPYGWGNLFFYNDCSAELKSLFTPFGLWLPRHSSEQIRVGKMIDVTKLSKTERINYLRDNGRNYLTIVYIGGHILLYVGNYPVAGHASSAPMTYQNMWGLSPTPAKRRSVVGQAVLFPLLEQYPEDERLKTQAAKTYFKIAYLDQFPNDNYLLRSAPTNLKSLMNPGLFDL